jgi:hypothetical protein
MMWVRDHEWNMFATEEDQSGFLIVSKEAQLRIISSSTEDNVIWEGVEGEMEFALFILKAIWEEITEQEGERIFIDIPSIVGMLDEELKAQRERVDAEQAPTYTAYLRAFCNAEGKPSLQVHSTPAYAPMTYDILEVSGPTQARANVLLISQMQTRTGLVAIGGQAVRWEDVRAAYLDGRVAYLDGST